MYLLQTVFREIQDKSSADQWMYVDTKNNQADDGSRGLRAGQLSKSKWIAGSEFLWKSEDEWRLPSKEMPELLKEDPEVKPATCMTSVVSPAWPGLVERLTYFSDWQRAKKAVALCQRYIRKLQL